MNRLILSALGLGAALVCALPAAAQDEASVHVSYADLNLSSPNGAAAFKQRMDAAVTQICGRASGVDLTRVAIVDNCRATVGAAARGQMDAVIAAVQHPQTLASAKAVTLASR